MKPLLLRLLPFALFFPVTSAEVVPNALFSDHAVLQQGDPIPVWGQAAPGETVTVRFRGEEVSTRAHSSGYWRVDLPVGEAGGPFELIFRGEDNEVRARDVRVGEVWLASGQSNMERQLGPRSGQQPIDNGMAEAAKADYPRFRMFTVPRETAFEPQDALEGEWVVCSPDTANDFSAVAFFFGRDLLAELDVPVGILHSSWGGSPAQAWTSREVVSEFPKHREVLEAWAAADNDESVANRQALGRNLEWLSRNDPATRRMPTEGLPSTFEETIPMPQKWEDAGFKDLDGVVWLRRSFELPETWDGVEAELHLGPVDDLDTTWINGREVGSQMGPRDSREYPVPAGLLRAGTNDVLIRVLDHRGGGGLTESEITPRLVQTENPEKTVSLRGPWQMHVSLDLRDAREPIPGRVLPRLKNSPSILYNAMIAPVIPYAMRGVIWYQGESNSGDPEDYQDLFPAMIEDWRTRWGRGDFPFLFVQIAPHERMSPGIREAQLLTLDRSPNTAMAVLTDIGDATDIHPTNKEPVGERLALAARALAYGQPIVYSGPLYEDVRFEGGRAIVSFESVGPGLVSGDGEPLRGFTLAGPDDAFHPAEAEIVGEEVVVTSGEVDEPTAVRYGWTNVPDVNLFNRAGLPASPFRTDAGE